MNSGANIQVRRDPDRVRQALGGLVMAWARDAATGEPRYILELGPDRRGGKCGCECPSCGLPLVAVNAAKVQFQRRPHFRHPEGSGSTDCQVLAARLALLRSLRDGGSIALPSRRVKASSLGLSGRSYEVYAERAPTLMHIRSVDFRDRAGARITLDDGRVLLVQLTGSTGSGDGPTGEQAEFQSTITIDVSDPALASIDPQELRRRLQLQPNPVCWMSHWDDATLKLEAAAAARSLAIEHLDEAPEDIELDPDLSPELKRETVLHLEVKRILAEVAQLHTPGISQVVSTRSVDGRALQRRCGLDPEALALKDVALERRFGRLIPDVTSTARGISSGTWFRPLLIEVTVSNPIDSDRLQRIRSAKVASLEIDLSRVGGEVTRSGLRAMVVHETHFKRWLFHPEFEALLLDAQTRLEEEAAQAQARQQEDVQVERERQAQAREQEQRRLAILHAPLETLAAKYLDAVGALVSAQADVDARPGSEESLAGKAAESAALPRVAEAVQHLSMRGYPESGDQALIGHHGIVSRILSIKQDQGVGYKLDNGIGVLNAIRQESGARLSRHTLYLIAAKVYLKALPAKQQEWVDEWAKAVGSSIKADERTYLRDPVFDRVLSVLFPEMAEPLAKPFGKLPAPPDPVAEDLERRIGRMQSTHRGSLRPPVRDKSPRGASSSWPYLDTRRGDDRLKGRDLAAWKKANPEAARAFFGDDPDPLDD